MAKKLSLLACLICLCLIFCSCGKITEGEINNKEFIPKHTRTVIVPMHISNGKTSTTIMIPYIYHYPDTWKIEIFTYNKDNKKETATYRVTKEVYDTVNIGDEFKYDKKYEPKEPEYTRKKK